MGSRVVLPRFYSVFLSHYSSAALLLPVSYNQHLPRRLPKTAILMGTGGRFWKVAMVSKREQVYFEQGWGDFVVDNELKDGEFLTFVFDGHQSYEVSIYGHGGCKETRAAIEVEEISDETEGENSVESSLGNVMHDETEINNGVEESLDGVVQMEESIDDTESDKDYSPESSQDNTAISVASPIVRSRNRVKITIENPVAYLDDPTNVCFVTGLKNRTYELLVYAQLVKDYCLQFDQKVDYMDRYGKLTARSTNWADQRVCIKKWNKICERNQLTENDVVVCELLRSPMDKVVYAIKIHIVRGAANAD